jgi:hypothetical protein
MARVVAACSSCRAFTGDVTQFEVEGRTVRQAIAIDGEIHQDALFAPLGPASEVYLIPRIGGG